MANRNKNTEIFREKSLERVSSPEELDKYVRTTTPSLWLLLGSIIVLLIGIIAWASFDKIESNSVVGCKVEDGVLTSYIKENDYQKLCEESYVLIDGEQCLITAHEGPFLASDDADRFLLQAAGIEAGEWYYRINCNTAKADGEYKGKAVFEKISPISFIIN